MSTSTDSKYIRISGKKDVRIQYNPDLLCQSQRHSAQSSFREAVYTLYCLERYGKPAIRLPGIITDPSIATGIQKPSNWCPNQV